MSISFLWTHHWLHSSLSERLDQLSRHYTRCRTTPTVTAAACSSDKRDGRTSVSVVTTLVILSCAGISAIAVPPLVRTVREKAQQAQCVDRMKELGIAMHNYYYEHDSFPPAYLVDKNGKPMHSWRVLLLPWLGEAGLYNEYRFEEPWDSPHNMAVGKKLGPYFHCPSDSGSSKSQTSYMMIVGTGMISDGTSVARFESSISDGSANTILLVEVTDSGVYWWEPRDLDASQMSFKVNSASGTEIGSRHPGVANVLMCAGHVESTSENTEPEQIRAMATIAGGERIALKGGH